jgi:hypothetical protein
MMAKVNKRLSEETGELIEEWSAEEMWESRRPATSDMPQEKGRKGGGMMPSEAPKPDAGCEGMDLDKKQSIDDLSCGRIKRSA